MTPIDSKQVISLLNAQLSKAESVESQLKKLFTIWRGTVVSRHSWRGRLASWITHPSESENIHRKVCKVYAQFLVTEPQAKAKYNAETLKFLQWAKKNDLHPVIPAVQDALHAAPEIEELRRAAEENKVEKESIQISAASLNEWGRHGDILSEASLKKIFELSKSNELSDEDLVFIKGYLEAHPDMAVEGWEGRFEQIRSNFSKVNQLSIPLARGTEEERSHIIESESRQLFEKVMNLKLEDGGFFHLQRYGSRVSLSDKIGRVLSQLPEVVLDNFPDEIKKMIREGRTPEPHQMAEFLFHSFYSGESGDEPYIAGQELLGSRLSFLSGLLPDNRRSIDGMSTALLPDILKYYTEKMARSGVLLTGVGLMGSLRAQEICTWLAVNSAEIVRNPENLALKNLFISKIEAILIALEEPIKAKVKDYVGNSFDHIGKNIPGVVFEFSEIEDLFLQGDIWFEFHRQKDGKFALCLYTTGQGLNYHPTSGVEGTRKFCLKLQDIEPEKLNLNFFESLVQRNWESVWNKDFSSIARDVYHTVLEPLNGTPAKEEQKVFISKMFVVDSGHFDKVLEPKVNPIQLVNLSPTEAHSSFSTVMHLLMKQDDVKGHLVFDLLWNHLIDFCRENCIQGEVLEINQEQREFLEPLLKKVYEQYEVVKNLPAYQKKADLIEKTLRDLNQALQASSKVVVGEGEALSALQTVELKIQETLLSLGLTSEKMLQLESMMVWFFGDEVKNIIHPFVSELRSVFPEAVEETKNKEIAPVKVESGVIQGTYATLYLDFAWKIAKVLMLASGFLAGGAWTALSIPTLLSVLPYVLPEQYYQYYCNTMVALRYAIAKKLFQVSWNYLFSNKTKQNFLNLQTFIFEKMSLQKPEKFFPEFSLGREPTITQHQRVEVAAPLVQNDKVDMSARRIRIDEAGAVNIEPNMDVLLKDGGAITPTNLKDIIDYFHDLPNTTSSKIYICERIISTRIHDQFENWQGAFDYSEAIKDLYKLRCILLADFETPFFRIGAIYLTLIMNSLLQRDGGTRVRDPLAKCYVIKCIKEDIEWAQKTKLDCDGISIALGNDDFVIDSSLDNWFPGMDLVGGFFDKMQPDQNDTPTSKKTYKDWRVEAINSILISFREWNMGVYDRLSDTIVAKGINLHIPLIAPQIEHSGSLLDILYELPSCGSDEFFARVRSLPLPHKDSEWDTVTDVDSVIQQIDMIFVNSLNNITETEDSVWAITNRVQHNLKKLLASYRLLAILDSFVRRKIDTVLVTDELQHPLQRGVSFDYYDLLKYAFNHSNTLKDPKDAEELETLLKFLLPEIDLINPPLPQELEEFSNDSYQNTIHNVNRVEFEQKMEKLYKVLNADNVDGDRNRHPYYVTNCHVFVARFFSCLTTAKKFTNCSEPKLRWPTAQVRWQQLEFDPTAIMCPPDINPLCSRRRQNEIIGQDRDEAVQQSEFVGIETSEMVSGIIAYYTRNPHDYLKDSFISDMYNRLSSVLFRPGYLKEAIEHNPRIIDKLCEMLQSNFQSMRQIGTKTDVKETSYQYVNQVYWMRLLANLAQSLENYCEMYQPGSRQKFQFIEGWIAEIKQKRHCDDLLSSFVVEMEMERVPQDPDTVNNQEEYLRCLRVLLTAQIFHNKEIAKGRWGQWAPRIAALFQSEDTLVKERVLIELYKEQGFPEDFSRQLIEKIQFSVSRENNLIITQPEANMQALQYSYQSYERLQSILGEGPFRHLDMVDRYTFQTKNGKDIYRIVPHYNAFLNRSGEYEIIREVCDDKGITSIFRHLQLNHIKITHRVQQLLQRANQADNNSKQYYQTHSEAAWLQVFKEDRAEIDSERERQLLMSLIDLSTGRRTEEVCFTGNHSELWEKIYGSSEALTPEQTENLTSVTYEAQDADDGFVYNEHSELLGMIFDRFTGRLNRTIGEGNDRKFEHIEINNTNAPATQGPNVSPSIDLNSRANLEAVLKPLSGFCSFDETNFETDETTGTLKSFEFIPYGLKFNLVTDTSGEIRAESVQFPGYYIAKSQYHDAIAGIAHTLVLETSAGKQKVIVSGKNSYLNLAGLWTRLDVISGPLVKSIVDKIAAKFKGIATQFYAFDVVVGESAKPKLVSEDQRGLAFLLVHHLYRMEYAAAEEQCREIERIYLHQAVPENFWPEINYLLVPGLVPEMAQFRWRVISAKMMNKSIHPLPSTTEAEVDLTGGLFPKAMNLTIMLDLIAFMDDPKVRSYLTDQQEYFLYQYLIGIIVDVIKDKLPHNHYLSAFLNRDFIETIFGFAPFNQMPLIKRYGQLKGILGNEPIGPGQKMYEWVSRFMAASSALPEFHGKVSAYTAPETLRDNSVVKGLANLRRLQVSSHNQSNVFNAKKLLNEISRWEFCRIKVDFDHFKVQSVKSHFIYYYALLKADQISNIDPNGELKLKLSQALLRNKGLGDKHTQKLTDILIKVSQMSGAYPSTLELSESHERGRDGTKEGFDKWDKFISNLYERVLVQDLCCTVLAPVLGWGAVRMSDNILGGLISPFIDTSKTAADTIQSISIGKAKTHFSTLLTNATQKYINQITTQIVGKIRGAKPMHIAIGGAAAATTAYAASWMVGNMIAAAIQPTVEENSDESEPTPSKWMQTLAPLVPVALVGGNMLTAYWRKNSVTVSDVLPLKYTTPLQFAAKVGRTVYSLYQDHQQAMVKGQEPVKCEDLSLEELVSQEKMIDDFMSEMFDLAFTAEIKSSFDEDAVQIELLDETKATTPFEKERLTRVNNSISEFYKQKIQNGKTVYALKQDPQFEAIFVRLQLFQTVLNQAVEAQKAELEKLLKMSFARIEKSVDNQYAQLFAEASSLNEAQRPWVKVALARIYLKQSRIKQIQELLNMAPELIYLSNESKKWMPKNYRSQRHYFLADKLATGLKVVTTYDLATTDPRLAFINARFEGATGKKLWKRQAEKLALAKDGDIILELAPGDGKTAVVGQELVAYGADGEHLVMPIYPKQLAGDNMRTVHMQSHQNFNRLTYRFKFNRDLDLHNHTLEDLRVIMNGAVRNGEGIQMTKEDAQALRSIFVERGYDYMQVARGVMEKIKDKLLFSKDETKRGLILLHSMLKIMFTKGIAIPDETHETYAHRKQLNYPIGAPVNMDQEYARIIEAVFREAINCPELLGAFLENEACFFDTDTYDKIHKQTIAEALSNWKLLMIPGQNAAIIEERKVEFKLFVCEKLDYIPTWMTKDAQLFRRISLIKGLLNDLLPRSFKSRSGVNFGRKEGDKTEFARPSDGNNGASTTDSIKNPFEAYVKTVLMLLDRGLNEEQFGRILKKIKRLTKKEMDKEKVPFAQTSVARQFPQITPALLNSKDKTLINDVFHQLRKNPHLCLLYTRFFIRKEITYWKHNIENNSQDFASMFASQISYTGTPYNDGTYPAWMKMEHDKTTIGELLDIIARRLKGVDLLQTTRPRPVLVEIIETYFKKGTNFSALIDGGALFTGLSNREVAEAMFQYCVVSRAEEKDNTIEAVLFYMEDKHGSEQLHCLKKGEDGPKLASEVSLDPEKCLTYYDQRHGFGADVKQLGDGLATMGPNHPLYRWLQEVFRIRGLKNDSKLTPWALDLLKENKIQVVMTKDVQKLILDAAEPDHIPTLSEILEYAVRNESEIAKEENYPSLLSKIREVPCKAIYAKMMKIPSEKFEQWFPLFEEFQSLFISKVQDDPAQLFGHVKKEVDIDEALESARVRNIEPFLENPHVTFLEGLEISEAIKNLPRPVLAQRVMVAVGPDGRINDEASLDLGLEQTVELSLDQKDQVEQNEDVNQEQEQDQDLNQDQNVSSQRRKKKPYRYADVKWPADFDPTLVGALPFVDSAQSKRDYYGYNKTTCPVFTVQSLLDVAQNPLIRQTKPYFDARLWFSNNITPRHVKGLNETAIDIADEHQLPLRYVLVHFEMVKNQPKIIKLGAISIHDAAFMKEKFHVSNKKVKTVLWNCDLNLLDTGDKQFEQALIDSEDFNTLLVQLKILDGQVDFTKEQPALVNWMKKNKNNKLFEGVEAIITSHGRVYKGTHLDKMCRKMDSSFSLMDMM